jgi:hypothetical protein
MVVLIRLLISLLIVGVEGQSGGPNCDLDSYSVPYARIQGKRNGPHIEEREHSGFIDCTKYIHKILCINGPYVISTFFIK